MEERGVEPFKAWLEAEIGAWPLITSNWSESNFDATQYIINTYKYIVSFAALLLIGQFSCLSACTCLHTRLPACLTVSIPRYFEEGML